MVEEKKSSVWLDVRDLEENFTSLAKVKKEIMKLTTQKMDLKERKSEYIAARKVMQEKNILSGSAGFLVVMTSTVALAKIREIDIQLKDLREHMDILLTKNAEHLEVVRTLQPQLAPQNTNEFLISETNLSGAVKEEQWLALFKTFNKIKTRMSESNTPDAIIQHAIVDVRKYRPIKELLDRHFSPKRDARECKVNFRIELSCLQAYMEMDAAMSHAARIWGVSSLLMLTQLPNIFEFISPACRLNRIVDCLLGDPARHSCYPIDNSLKINFNVSYPDCTMDYDIPCSVTIAVSRKFALRSHLYDEEARLLDEQGTHKSDCDVFTLSNLMVDLRYLSPVCKKEHMEMYFLISQIAKQALTQNKTTTKIDASIINHIMSFITIAPFCTISHNLHISKQPVIHNSDDSNECLTSA